MAGVIFEADPDQIDALDSKQLVHLMKLLLLAECRVAQIPLRAAHVPLQITISDGGEDGRVEWSDGAASCYLTGSITEQRGSKNWVSGIRR